MNAKITGSFILSILITPNIFAQDCPNETETKTYYGNSTASCTARFTNFAAANGRCVNNYTEYSIQQFVEETESKEKRIRQDKIVENNSCSNGQVTSLGEAIVSLSCRARLTVSRQEEVVTGKKCNKIDYLDLAGEIYPLSEGVNNSNSRTIKLSKNQTEEVLTWYSEYGNTRIEYAHIPRNTKAELEWLPIGLFGPDTSYELLDLKKFLPADTEYVTSRCPPLLKPGFSRFPDARIAIRIRSESFNGNFKSGWSYSEINNIYYGALKTCFPNGLVYNLERGAMVISGV